MLHRYIKNIILYKHNSVCINTYEEDALRIVKLKLNYILLWFRYLLYIIYFTESKEIVF